MADHTPPEVSEEDLQHAQDLWKNFTIGMKYTVYATCAILVLIALIMVDFS